MERLKLTRGNLLRAGAAAGVALGTGLAALPARSDTMLDRVYDRAPGPGSSFDVVDAQAYASDVWYLPVESLIGEMNRAGVARAVLVQYDVEVDNDYQFDAVRRYPGKFANVVAVNYALPDAPRTLAALAAKGVSGVRIPAKVRSAGNDPFAIWKAAAAANLPVSCSGTTADFMDPSFVQIITTVPHIPIVLEHAGGAYGSTAPIDDLRQIYTLAAFQNVYVKIGGLSEFDRRITPVPEPFPFVVPVPPVLELAYSFFGPNRMMWGSDYPPVAGREGYGNSLRYTLGQLKSKSVDDLSWIFGRTASTVFPVQK
jgi:L-fuconolactonase